MGITRASTDDAMQIYTLAVAYLHNAGNGGSPLVSTWHVKEKWGDIFYFLRQGQSVENGQPLTPIAVCTYRMMTKTWTVELSNGEKLTLLDREDTWDIVGGVEKEPKPKIAKSGMRSYRTKVQSNNTKTRWPDGFDPIAAGAILVED